MGNIIRAVVLTAEKEHGEHLKLLLISAGIRKCESYTDEYTAVNAAARLNANLIVLEQNFLEPCHKLALHLKKPRLKYITLRTGLSCLNDMKCLDESYVSGCLIEPIDMEVLSNVVQRMADNK